MKHIAAVLGPLLRWTKDQSAGWRRLATVIIFIGFVGGGSLIGIHLSSEKTSGWHTTTGVVVKAGTVPVNPQTYLTVLTKSTVSYHDGNTAFTRTLAVPWWHHDGAHIQIWLKPGQMAT